MKKIWKKSKTKKYNVNFELAIENTIQVEAKSTEEAEKIAKKRFLEAFSFLQGRNELNDWDVTKTYINAEVE